LFYSYQSHHLAPASVFVGIYVANLYALFEVEAKHKTAAVDPELMNRSGLRVATTHLGLHGGFDFGVDFVLLNYLHFVSPSFVELM
jgi:hypothetical protein